MFLAFRCGATMITEAIIRVLQPLDLENGELSTKSEIEKKPIIS